jgi:ABC-type phosphate transport system substrate-binding protein
MMMTIKRIRLSAVYYSIAAIAILIISCGGGDSADEGKWDSINSGELTVLCDDAIWSLMQEPFKWYGEFYPKVKFTSKKVSAFEAMKKLLSADTLEGRAIIVARDYTPREDSLMKSFKVDKHQREPIAKDALVFFVQKDFPIDTISAAQLEEILTTKNTGFSDYYPQIKLEPFFAINSHRSSEYDNLLMKVLKGRSIQKRLTFFSGADSVINYVHNNKQAIGIGYLSQVVRDGTIKSLKIGFTDTSGKYINAKPVHQGYIVQELYPYIVTYYVYMLEKRQNLPFWFGMFVARETKVQRHFLDAGIVPAYAKIHLIPEEY